MAAQQMVKAMVGTAGGGQSILSDTDTASRHSLSSAESSKQKGRRAREGSVTCVASRKIGVEGWGVGGGSVTCGKQKGRRGGGLLPVVNRKVGEEGGLIYLW